MIGRLLLTSAVLLASFPGAALAVRYRDPSPGYELLIRDSANYGNGVRHFLNSVGAYDPYSPVRIQENLCFNPGKLRAAAQSYTVKMGNTDEAQKSATMGLKVLYAIYSRYGCDYGDRD